MPQNFFKNLFFFNKFIFILLKSNLLLDVSRLRFTKNHSKRLNLQSNIGKTLVHILPKFGPVFCKLGQILSIRPDIIGKEISESLVVLQNKAPPFPYKKIEKIFEKEFSKSLDESFESFEEDSVTAASVAQVYKAKTKEGHYVAVKFLRPNIDKIYLQNLNFINTISSFINLFLNKKNKINISEVTDVLKKNCEIELDLRLEAAAADKIRENCKNDPDIYIPKIYWNLTSKNVLTAEWIDGIKINNQKKLISENFDLKLITKKLAIIFFNQTCRDGFFHADIHPGNILVKSNGDIALLDFGIVCHLNDQLRIFVVEVLHGFLNKNYEKVTEIHFDSGLIENNQSRYKFELACRSIGESIIGKSLQDISIAKLLKQLFEISKNFSVKINPDLLLLHKTILTIEGTGHLLNPEINMWNLATPWIQNWEKQNSGYRGKIKKINYLKNKITKNIDKIILRNFGNNFNIRSSNINTNKGNISFLIFFSVTFFILGIIIGKFLL
ncbi:MAG: ubiquinone biosynthesis protein [Candidatus Midichloriaceae bacterium]|jgi:ubiquinone biosynthesis protein